MFRNYLIGLSLMFSFPLAENCDEGYMPNCNPQYISSDGNNVQACCPGEWIGDGYPDCEDQQWGCDLSCYSSSDSTEPDCEMDSCSDGGDCSEDLIEVTIKNINPTALNDTTGVLNVSLNSNKVISNYTIQFTGINIYNTDQYESFLIEPPPDSDSDSDSIQDTIQVTIIDNQIVTSNDGVYIDSGESIFHIIVNNFNLDNNICFVPENSNITGANLDEYEVSWGSCYEIVQGCTDLSACNYNELANYNVPSLCSYNVDCAGICGGEAIEDQCGVCGGNNSTCLDCNNIANGEHILDACGNCLIAINVGENGSSENCFKDCAGIWGGSSLVDQCGVCNGNDTTCLDCYGVINGTAYYDGCGYCVGGSTNLIACNTDCAGVDGGTSFTDNCGQCVLLGDFSCIQGCDGIWLNNGLQLVYDACEICGGDNSTCLDCANDLNGSSYINECGECVSSGDNYCLQGCDGIWASDGSHKVIDECGICSGNNTTCQGCTNPNACNFDQLALINDGSCIHPQGCNNWCEGDIESLKQRDCLGDCGGSAQFDICGDCDGKAVHYSECNTICPSGNIDCMGECDGGWVLDYCGVCFNGNLTNYNSTCLCPEEIEINDKTYCKADIDLLQYFIDNSSNFGSNQDLTLNRELYDGNQNGLIEPYELGVQIWSEDGQNRLQSWDCKNCGLIGDIPSDINKLKYLRYLDLSNNNLSGIIPITLGQMGNLRSINLSYNHFTGYDDDIINRLKVLYQEDSNNIEGLPVFIESSLGGNLLCNPLSKSIVEYLNWDTNEDHYINSQRCNVSNINKEIHILYPHNEVNRYTDDTSIPIELLVTNLKIGNRIDGGNVELRYIIDGEISEYGLNSTLSGRRLESSFGIWGHSFGNHNLKVWLVDADDYTMKKDDNGNDLIAEVNYSISYNISGCTDALACNFNILASDNDGSCRYAVDGCCLDYCGICDGDNDCIPNVLNISKEDGSILTVNEKNISIVFSHNLHADSKQGIKVNSKIDGPITDIISLDLGSNMKTILVDFQTYNLISGDEITIVLESNYIRPEDDNDNLKIMGNLYSDSTWSYNVEYLGDFNHSAYNGNGIIIDHEDIDLLIQHWGGSDIHDYNFELGPCINGPCNFQDAPYLRPHFDNIWDIEDLQSFVIMWNYSNIGLEKITIDKKTPNYGEKPVIKFENNALVMILPYLEQKINHIWVEIAFNGDEKVSISHPVFNGNFDMALKREIHNSNILQWSLIDLDGHKNKEKIILGKLSNTKIEIPTIDVQYKITSKNGKISSGSTKVTYSPMPDDFEFSVPYPNPFNPQVKISYEIVENADVILSVYDIKGSLINYIVKGEKTIGRYQAVWDGSSYSSGIYFVRLQVSNENSKILFDKTQKLNLIK